MKIFCIGKNYALHAQEMGGEVPEHPLIFLKPATALLEKSFLSYPTFTEELHYEAELVIKMAQTGYQIDLATAPDFYEHITVGLDFTARDLQRQLKKEGHPWEIAKGFDNSAAVGKWLPYAQFSSKEALTFSLFKNDQKVQEGNSTQLIFSFDYLIHYISQFFTINKGDLLFTGTPSGVGPVQPGDTLTGYLGKEQVLETSIA